MKSAQQKRGEFFAARSARLSFGVSGMLGSPSLGYFSWRDKKSNLLPGNPRPTVSGLAKSFTIVDSASTGSARTVRGQCATQSFAQYAQLDCFAATRLAM